MNWLLNRIGLMCCRICEKVRLRNGQRNGVCWVCLALLRIWHEENGETLTVPLDERESA